MSANNQEMNILAKFTPEQINSLGKIQEDIKKQLRKINMKKAQLKKQQKSLEEQQKQLDIEKQKIKKQVKVVEQKDVVEKQKIINTHTIQVIPENNNQFPTLQSGFNLNINNVIAQLKNYVATEGKFKIKYTSLCQFTDKDQKIEYATLKSDYQFILETQDQDVIVQLIDKIYMHCEDQILRYGRSDYKLHNVDNFDLKMIKFNYGMGSYIKLVDKIKNKQACKNVENKDNYCLIYAYMLQQYIDSCNKNQKKNDLKHYERASNYVFSIQNNMLQMKYIQINKNERFEINENISIQDIQFPCCDTDIKRFAHRTKTNILALSYFIENEVIQFSPIINVDNEENKKSLNVLIVQNDEKSDQHVVLISNLNALLFSSEGHKEQYFCRQCLNRFNSNDQLNSHYVVCKQLKQHPSLDIYPIEGKNDTLQFTDHRKSVEVPYFFTCDFEAILIPSKYKTLKQFKCKQSSVNNDEQETLIQKHKIINYGLQLVSHDKKKDIYINFTGKSTKEVIEHLMKNIYEITEELDFEIQNTNKNFVLTEEIKLMKKNATKCYICNQTFEKYEIGNPKSIKTIDHNHLTGKIRGIAHQDCNLQFNLYKSKIPVIFHNGGKYDFHPILKYMGKFVEQKVFEIEQQIKQTSDKKELSKLYKQKYNVQRIDCIAQNNEKVQSFVFNKNRFIDSIQFMKNSLNNLGNTLTFEQKYYTVNYIRELFPNLDDSQIINLIQKGQFPYEWFDNLDKLNNVDFPNYECFYSKLNQSNISVKEYNDAKKIYNDLNMKSFKDYLDFYQAIDVKLLADIWKNFQITCLKNIQLDPNYFVSAPSLSYQASLKYDNVKIQLISDPTMYQFVEQAMRGGVSNTGSLNYAKANNKYVKGYNPNVEESFICYYDLNNMYGCSMTTNLPVNGYLWRNNLTQDEIEQYQDNSEIGYFVKCDLQYPVEIHDLTNDLPLAPERLKSSQLSLSKFQKDMIDKLKNEYNVDINGSDDYKLVSNLNDKIGYVCHISTLKYYLSMGMKLIKQYEVLQFNQSPFLKKYVEYNTAQRHIAKKNNDKFGEDFYKLMVNSVYGKQLENVRNRQNFKLVFDSKQMQKIVNSRYFKNYVEISKNCLLVSQYNKQTILNKHIIAGISILEHSKTLIYKYYYQYFQKQFKSSKVVFSDTDSVCMQVICKDKNKDVYDIMIENNQMYDFSKISQKSPIYERLQNYYKQNNMNAEQQQQFVENSMRIGVMKDECINNPISEVVALKSKCYSYITNDDLTHMKNKGIKQSVMDKQVKHQDYLNCINQWKIKNVTQYNIQSFQHQLYTTKSEKVALQPLNSKRYQIDPINSFAYGNYRIQEIEQKQN